MQGLKVKVGPNKEVKGSVTKAVDEGVERVVLEKGMDNGVPVYGTYRVEA